MLLIRKTLTVVDCIANYINFCVTLMKVLCFSNNKTCINHEIKALFKEKRAVFTGNKLRKVMNVNASTRRSATAVTSLTVEAI